MQGCYRNGLDGGRDMRSFSGLYFFLRMVVYIVVYVVQSIAKHHVSEWYSAGVVLLIATLTMALVQPCLFGHIVYLIFVCVREF